MGNFIGFLVNAIYENKWNSTSETLLKLAIMEFKLSKFYVQFYALHTISHMNIQENNNKQANFSHAKVLGVKHFCILQAMAFYLFILYAAICYTSNVFAYNIYLIFQIWIIFIAFTRRAMW